MKYKWLNKKQNKKLIIFFNGWGMDENIVSHLGCDDFDVLMFFDYNTLNSDFDFEKLETYQEKHLLAWSMGVMIGSIFVDKIGTINNSIAINGSLKPIDEDFGIHPKIYDLTIKGFNEKGREKFIKSMFSKDSDFTCESSRKISEQHSELIALKEYKSNENFKYNKVLISDEDKIIPTKSQVKFWNIEPNFESGHCPFLQFSKWSELL